MKKPTKLSHLYGKADWLAKFLFAIPKIDKLRRCSYLHGAYAVNGKSPETIRKAFPWKAVEDELKSKGVL